MLVGVDVLFMVIMCGICILKFLKMVVMKGNCDMVCVCIGVMGR